MDIPENTEQHPYRDATGSFKKGNPGRPKMVGNKVTLKIKEAIADFILDNIDQVQENFDKLRPLQKLQFLSALLPYAIPKLQNVEGELNQNHTGGITITWTDPKLPDSSDKGSTGVIQSLPAGLQDNSQSRGDEVG